MKKFKNIIITGASSGLGRELAIAYSDSFTNLCLIGRDREKLWQTSSICRGMGAEAFDAIGDVKDAQEISNIIQEFNTLYPVDLVIACAGISGGTAGGGEDINQIKNIFDTNLYGVINTIHPVIDLMQERGRGGSIAIISSLAGINGMPGAPAYSASKAAVKNYGDALRVNLKKCNIDVSVICPGFIETPMTDVNKFPMPFKMKADYAAEKIKRQIAKGTGFYAFPAPLYAITSLIAILPPALQDKILALSPAKE